MIELEFGRNAEKDKLNVTCAGKVICMDVDVDKSVSKKHLRLTLQENGDIKLYNLNIDNETFLNGVSILETKTKLTDNPVIVLGSKFVLPLKEVLNAVGYRQTYSIGHLKEVIANYKDDKMKLQIAIGRQNAMRGLMPVFMALAGVLAFTGILPESVRVVPSIISLVSACYFGYVGFVSASTNPKKQKELDDRYRKDCVCPDCGVFLSGEYNDILKRGACPVCHSKFKE